MCFVAEACWSPLHGEQPLYRGICHYKQQNDSVRRPTKKPSNRVQNRRPQTTSHQRQCITYSRVLSLQILIILFQYVAQAQSTSPPSVSSFILQVIVGLSANSFIIRLRRH
ncbi:hypothetical protein F5Y19DRAFT_415435 [Xylariaceae sp. FL1651]|nr:hypothetical protein F5Y19DRAFT_415435 [Xylariaceae sp. FL1651]